MLTFFSWALEDLGEQSIIRTFSNQSFKSFNQSFTQTLEDLRQQSIIQTFFQSINRSPLFSLGHSWTYKSNQSFKPFSNQSFTLLQLRTRGPATAISHSALFQSIIHPLQSGTHGPATAINHSHPFNQSFYLLQLGTRGPTRAISHSNRFPINHSPFFSLELEDLRKQSFIQTLSNQSFKPFQSSIHPNTRGLTTSINHSNLFPINQTFTLIQFGALMDLQEQSVIQTVSKQLFTILQLGTERRSRAINHSNLFQSIIHHSSGLCAERHRRTINHSNLSNQSFTILQLGIRGPTTATNHSALFNQSFTLLQLGTRGPMRAINHSSLSNQLFAILQLGTERSRTAINHSNLFNQ